MSDKLPDVIISREVADFLLGIAPLEGRWFGDTGPIEGGYRRQLWIISTDGIYVRHFDHKERYNAAVTLNNDSALKIVQLEAVLNRVRSDLEALANKHRDDKRFRPIWAVRGDFVDELVALAATLEPGEIK